MYFVVIERKKTLQKKRKKEKKSNYKNSVLTYISEQTRFERGFKSIKKIIYKEKCGTVTKPNQKIRLVKDALSGVRQFLTNENPLKMMKNAFYVTLTALFVLKIFCSCRKNVLTRKIRLISKFMASQPGIKTIW